MHKVMILGIMNAIYPLSRCLQILLSIQGVHILASNDFFPLALALGNFARGFPWAVGAKVSADSLSTLNPS